MDSAGKPFAYTIVLLLLQASRYTFTFSRSALHDALASSQSVGQHSHMQSPGQQSELGQQSNNTRPWVQTNSLFLAPPPQSLPRASSTVASKLHGFGSQLLVTQSVRSTYKSECQLLQLLLKRAAAKYCSSRQLGSSVQQKSTSVGLGMRFIMMSVSNFSCRQQVGSLALLFFYGKYDYCTNWSVGIDQFIQQTDSHKQSILRMNQLVQHRVDDTVRTDRLCELVFVDGWATNCN